MKIRKNKKKTLLIFSFYVYAIGKYLMGNQDSGDSRYVVAYLDPGTGTMIISAIIGIIATIVLGVKTFWYKIVHIFKPANKNGFSKRSDDKT